VRDISSNRWRATGEEEEEEGVVGKEDGRGIGGRKIPGPGAEFHQMAGTLPGR
jgi:hypothetical protein